MKTYKDFVNDYDLDSYNNIVEMIIPYESSLEFISNVLSAYLISLTRLDFEDGKVVLTFMELDDWQNP